MLDPAMRDECYSSLYAVTAQQEDAALPLFLARLTIILMEMLGDTDKFEAALSEAANFRSSRQQVSS